MPSGRWQAISDPYPTIPPRAADPPWPGAQTTETHTGIFTIFLMMNEAAYDMTHARGIVAVWSIHTSALLH